MVIFLLAECPLCGSRYAVARDPSVELHWLVFERRPRVNWPSHICIGRLLCVNGHTLDIVAEEAVLTSEGHWLVLTVSHPEPVLN